MPNAPIPYKIACLCEIRDPQGRILLLHRVKPPNRHLYSPIGGKLEQHTGESPTACAIREIHEEVGLALHPKDLALLGIISENAYATSDAEKPNHWLMFWFRVLPPIDPARIPESFDEGTLVWTNEQDLHNLPLPETDRTAIWPAVLQHSDNTPPGRPRLGFFALYIDCTTKPPTSTLEQSSPPMLPPHHA